MEIRMATFHRIVKDETQHTSKTLSREQIPVIDISLSTPLIGSIAYNKPASATYPISDTIYYADGTRWIPIDGSLGPQEIEFHFSDFQGIVSPNTTVTRYIGQGNTSVAATDSDFLRVAYPICRDISPTSILGAIKLFSIGTVQVRVDLAYALCPPESGGPITVVIVTGPTIDATSAGVAPVASCDTAAIAPGLLPAGTLVAIRLEAISVAGSGFLAAATVC